MKFCVKEQLSIVIPNEPGQIAKVSDIMAQNNVNISGVMFVDTMAQGVVRFVTENATAAQKTLEEAGFFVVLAEIIEVEFENEVGALHVMSKALGDAGINIDYAYGSDNPNPNEMKVAFKMSDTHKALEILKNL